MGQEAEQHITAVEATYGPLVLNNPRLDGGIRLWRQFTGAVASYRQPGGAGFAPVYERINELAVARRLLIDESLVDFQILYEPPIAANNRRIDFVVPDVGGSNLYIEVKTVHPTAEDSDANWHKYQKRREHHTPNVHYVVEHEWMGAAIYGNSFSARSKFMEYVRDFEPRLDDAKQVTPGRGLLVFCGTGMQWHRSELEDFADFYRTGKHRQDDPFAAMEAEALRQTGTALRRNIAAFGFMKRPTDSTVDQDWVTDVRGPSRFQ